MRKFQLYILGFVLVLSNARLIGQHQSIDISFAARYYGQPLALDSVLIKNINRNCDTVIHAPDTILSILYTVGVNEAETQGFNTFIISEPYPNPSLDNKLSIDLLLPDNGFVVLKVFDLSGTPVISFNNYLTKGIHKIELTLNKSGTFILKMLFENVVRHKKISILKNTYASNSIKISSSSRPSNQIYLKENNKSAFWFEPGDTLWYVGYAQTPNQIFGSDVIESAPTSDTLIRLSIIEGVPCKRTEAVKHGGQLYTTVQIGEQCWIKENMNIGIMVNGDTNMTDNGVIEKYCYDNDIANCNIYGGLYQWNELMQYNTIDGSQGICPKGWHISTYDDLNLLTQDISANEIKETGSHHWLSGNNANNSTGFTALPTGYRGWNSGTFEMIYEGTGYFTSTSYLQDDNFAWDKTLYFASSWIVGAAAWKTGGESVRCIENQD